MSETTVDGWKRCLLRQCPNGAIEIAGAFAGHFGPLDARQECACGKSECWCGFSAHTTLAGAMRYHPLHQPIAQVAVGGWPRHGGGRKKEYLIGYSQRVTAILLPQYCAVSDCRQPAIGVTSSEDLTLRSACHMHGAGITPVPLAALCGIPVRWLSPDYTRWALTHA